MSMICSVCGAQLGPNSRFCPGCGAQILVQPGVQPQAPQGYAQPQGYTQAPQGYAPQGYVQPQGYMPQQQVQYAGNGRVRIGIPAPGWSDRVNDPEIKAKLKNQSRAGFVFGLFIIPLPFFGFVIYSLATGEMPLGQAVVSGFFVSLVFLIFTLIGKASGSKKNSYEGVVVDRIKEEQYDRDDDGQAMITIGGGATRTYGVTVVKTADGSRKKIREQLGTFSQPLAWDYFQVGDRMKCHPQFTGFPYERYDKAVYPFLYCVCCRTKNNIQDDRCKKCNAPLLK